MLETIWRSGRVHGLADYVRPSVPNGFEYECTAAGQTGAREPRWPVTVAGTITDGSVEWTARAYSTNGSDTIASVAGSADTGLTIASVTYDGTEVTFTLSGGTVGEWYIVSIEVTTTQGEVLEQKLKVYCYDE